MSRWLALVLSLLWLGAGCVSYRAVDVNRFAAQGPSHGRMSAEAALTIAKNQLTACIDNPQHGRHLEVLRADRYGFDVVYWVRGRSPEHPEVTRRCHAPWRGLDIAVQEAEKPTAAERYTIVHVFFASPEFPSISFASRPGGPTSRLSDVVLAFQTLAAEASAAGGTKP